MDNTVHALLQVTAAWRQSVLYPAMGLRGMNCTWSAYKRTGGGCMVTKHRAEIYYTFYRCYTAPRRRHAMHTSLQARVTPFFATRPAEFESPVRARMCGRLRLRRSPLRRTAFPQGSVWYMTGCSDQLFSFMVGSQRAHQSAGSSGFPL